MVSSCWYLHGTIHKPELFEAEEKVPSKEPEKDEKPLSLIDVRRILAEKSRDGHTEQVRLLLQKYGADKLSAIDVKVGQGLEERIPAVLDHHFATSLEDLKPEYLPGLPQGHQEARQ